MAERIREAPTFAGRGLTVQFHPAVTYEDFVVGLAPRPDAAGLGFRVRAGWLLRAVEAAEQSRGRPFLLTIDEINRGDLGKVLGRRSTSSSPVRLARSGSPTPGTAASSCASRTTST